MKVEQLLVQYLYQSKSVSLLNIGRFSISPEISIIPESEKSQVLPPDAIKFEYDGNAPIDEGLIDYIVQQTRKIKPLATSDLESYSILSRQFLNIGKPLIIEGLGSLQKSQEGNYIFTQGTYANARLELPKHNFTEKLSDDVDFSSPVKPKRSTGKGAVVTLVILLVAGAAALGYYLYSQKNAMKPLDVSTVQQADTNENNIDTSMLVRADSLVLKDSIPKNIHPAYTFKVIIKEYNNLKDADKNNKRFSSFGHTILQDQIDSTHFTLAIPFNTTLDDTLHIKDSLSRLFGVKAKISF